jgi:predicted nucleic acid-binding protein
MAALRTLLIAEPPADFRVRPPLVVDCSLLAAVLFQEPERDSAEARMAEHVLLAPVLLDFEIVNVALKKVRNGQTEESIRTALDCYAASDIVRLEVDAAALLPLAQRYRLSAYDAAYLWLAAELKAPLATFDARLGEAARVHLAAL